MDKDFFNELNIKIIRSKRKTLGMEISIDGLTIRVPHSKTDLQIREFIVSHQKWIEKHTKKAEQFQKQLDNIQPLTADEIHELADMASKIIPERVKYYAEKIGVDYGKITIRNQRTRWGSCSSKGNLSFNCLLMLMPPEIIDSIVVHELCHRKEMNHSNRFYAEVLRVFPQYNKCNKWLNENGPAIMKRNFNH